MSEDRILLGVTRPPQPPDTKYIDKDGKMKFVDVMLCPCGHSLWSREQIRAHWHQGHFDTPVYAARDEVLDRIAQRAGTPGQHKTETTDI